MEAGSAASLKAAQEAAAKVNAMLVASGQLKLSELNKKAKNVKSNDLFIDEVVINDAPMSARNFLTRSSTQEEISKMSGAAVSTRGRYMSPEERKTTGKKPIDRPLYLHIQAVNQQDVKVAVGRIMHIIMEHTHRRTQSMQRPRGPRPNLAPGLMGPRPGSGPRGPGGGPRGPRPFPFRPNRPDMSAPPPPIANILREKVFLPVNLGIPPADIRLRLLGENGMNLRYIGEETGVAISLRGIGSGYQEQNTGQEAQDSLHFYLEHDNQEKFNDAKDLVVNLAQTVIAEIQQIQQQQQPPQQQPQQQHHLQQGHGVPLFSQPPPQQPDVNIGGGGGMGQPHLAPVQLAVPQAPPPQIIHNQVVTQVPPHSQMVPPHVAQPQVAPGQVTLQGQVAGGQVGTGVLHHGLAQHGEVIQQPEVMQANVVCMSQQIVHLAPPVVSTAPAAPSQQLVHTSSGTQLVTLPPGTQIVNTPEGPRLVALASGTPGQVAAPIAHVQAAPQPQQDLVQQTQQQQAQQPQQQPVPQSLPASVANPHLAMNQPPVYADPSVQPAAQPQAPPTPYPNQGITNSVSSANPLTNPVLNGSHEATYPPNSSMPPPNSTAAAMGVPPPGATMGLAPVSTHPGTVSFVVTPGVNTLTTTTGVGVLVPHDPNNLAQLQTTPVVVTGIMHPSQQQTQQIAPPTSTPNYVGPIPQQQMQPTFTTQAPIEQPPTSAYLHADQVTITTTAAHQHQQLHQQQIHHQQQLQQQQRPVGVSYPNEHPPVAGPGIPEGPGMPGQMPPMQNLQQRPQGPKIEQQLQLNSGPAFYAPRPGLHEPRPGMGLEQQWQQFQQQVKMEGGGPGGPAPSGQQQYDPYAASDDTEHHDASPRHTQANSGIPVQQQPAHTQAQQPTQVTVAQQQQQITHPQQIQQQQQQQPQDPPEGNRSPNSSAKADIKNGGSSSPQSSYIYFQRGQQGPQPQTTQPQPQPRLEPPSPERGDHSQTGPGTDPRFQVQVSTPSDVAPQRSSPQTHTTHPQPVYVQAPFQGPAPPQNPPEGIPQQHEAPVYPQQMPQQLQHPQQIPPQAQGIPQQQLIAPQELGDPQLQPPPQQFQPEQFPPGGQYPWAQYPQPSNTPLTSGPATLGNGPGPFQSGPGVSGAGPNIPNSYALVNTSGSGTFISGGRFPNGQTNPFPMTNEDKKAEPGVGRDMTASLLMPPPPPPPPNEHPGSVHGREENPDSGLLKRQGPCSVKDEGVAAKRPREESDDPRCPDGIDRRHDDMFPGNPNFPGNSGPFPTGRRSLMGPGGRGVWERWGSGAQLQGPYTGMPMGPGPFNRAPTGPRNPRDLMNMEDGGIRRGMRGGINRGGFGMGVRGGNRRW